MTPLQVFLGYCKLRGIMPKMHSLMRNEIEEYKYNPDTRDWRLGKMTFEEFFQNNFAGNGFYEMFNNIVIKFGGWNFDTMPEELKLPGRRWHAFYTTNVIMDTKVNKNDTVKFVGYNGTIEIGKCLTDLPGDGTFSNRVLVAVERDQNVPRQTPPRQWVSPTDILEVNGEEYKLSYHIKWKRNVYGLKNVSKS